MNFINWNFTSTTLQKQKALFALRLTPKGPTKAVIEKRERDKCGR